MRTRAVPYAAMTATSEQQPTADQRAPRRRRGGLVAAAVAGVLVLMAGTGLSVWYFTHQAPEPDPKAGPNIAPATTDATGTVVLEYLQFTFDPNDMKCWGTRKFTDIRGGVTVTVTDAAGKVLGFATLDQGTASGRHDLPNGTQTAEQCTLPFKVSGVPRGVGPYGVEVAKRDVVHVNEGELGVIKLGWVG